MKVKDRYISKYIINDLEEKMVFLGGARQIGKTTVARELVSLKYKSSYFTYDKIENRNRALKGQWPADSELIILDEFHKFPKWKTWIKGEYDVNKSNHKFLLTGSARLNIYRRGGDSLQGRYHYYTLHTFSTSELEGLVPNIKPGNELKFKENARTEFVDILLKFGGFPEPLVKQDSRFLRRWQNEKIERFFKEDILELTNIKDFGNLALLADLLPERISAILSINSLSRDLQVNFRTVSNWLDVFEQFYYIYRIPPFQTKKIASVRKEKKLYIWDWSQIENKGSKLENFIASHLLKYCNFLNENEGYKISLNFLRDSTGREVDFLISENGKPWFAVEVKLSDFKVSKNLVFFKKKLNIPYCYQVVMNFEQDNLIDGIRVLGVKKFLSAFI